MKLLIVPGLILGGLRLFSRLGHPPTPPRLVYSCSSSIETELGRAPGEPPVLASCHNLHEPPSANGDRDTYTACRERALRFVPPRRADFRLAALLWRTSGASATRSPPEL